MDKDKIEQLAQLANQVARSTISTIDVLSLRGGFRGEEMSTIGRLRDQCTQLASLGEDVTNEIAEEE